MNRRGVALIFALLILTVLSILSASFFLKTINENNLAKRHMGSVRALWLAEAGAAEAFRNLSSSNSTLSGNLTIDIDKYSYDTTTTVKVDNLLYQINSTGRVNLTGSTNITRNITVFVTTDPYNSTDFPKAIEVNGELQVGGAANITPSNSTSEYANLSFTDKFGFSTEELKAYAIAQGNNYTNPDPNDVVVNDEIVWVDVDAGKSMTTQVGWNGTGLLIINGDADITGGTFSGILWVIGELRMSGNPDVYGAIFSECDADIDTKLTGTVFIEHNTTSIQDALDELTLLTKARVSWNEIF